MAKVVEADADSLKANGFVGGFCRNKENEEAAPCRHCQDLIDPSSVAILPSDKQTQHKVSPFSHICLFSDFCEKFEKCRRNATIDLSAFSIIFGYFYFFFKKIFRTHSIRIVSNARNVTIFWWICCISTKINSIYVEDIFVNKHTIVVPDVTRYVVFFKNLFFVFILVDLGQAIHQRRRKVLACTSLLLFRM